MHSTVVRAGFGLVWLIVFATTGLARAADQLIPGATHIVQTGTLANMIAKPDAGLFALPAGDPRVHGATLQIIDTGGGSPAMSVTLPAGGWTAVATPVGTLGYRYSGAGTPADPCRSVVVSPGAIEFECTGAGVTLAPPFAGNSAIILTVAIATRYCAAFGGSTLRNENGLLMRVNAPAPAACASPAGSTTSTTFVPSTTSTTIPSCCNNAMAVSFLTADVAGDCGDLVTTGGSPTTTNLACSGLYTGGGGNSVPLPYAVPDKGFAVTAITSCTGQTATLAAATSTQTGSNRSCTAPGCLFGAPLAVPNAGSTPTSVCVLNAVGGTTNGMLTCDTGATTLDLPLNSVIFLSGDVTTESGLQPCPVCRGPSGFEICSGGPNQGLGCTPGTNIGPGTGDLAYPTSHDCPPTASLNIGTLAVAFSLSSGTVTWSGTTATNDATTTASEQPRIFAGYCRDRVLPGASGAFQNPAKQCWQNGMAAGTACGTDGSTFESCQQRTEGAFGPNGGANRTITVIGNAMSILSGPNQATLVSVFAIAPTFDPTVDAAGDLPGPGAVSLVGTASLCSTAGTCP